MNNFHEQGFLRLRQILALLPVSKSTWWTGVRSGRFPQPVKLGPRISAWRVEDIRALLKSFPPASPKAGSQAAKS